MKQQQAAEIRSWMVEGKAFALLDVRETGQFGEGHLLHAISVPYSVLETEAAALISSADAPIRIVDFGDGVAARAARRLEAMGFTDVGIVVGGHDACEAAGFSIFKGENVPSKTLGELAETVGHTPHISAEELMEMIEKKENFILLDGRTPREFKNMSIPSGRTCPNAELGYRLPVLVSDPTTKVIVNCAGRTRSLVGAQSLRNLGFENPIYALKNGTQGWRLSGYELNRGLEPEPLPEVTGEAAVAAETRAKAFMAKHGIPFVDLATARAWSEDMSQAFYLYDIRSEEEYAKGHIPGALHMAGGQLVQKTDTKIAVRGARVVLCDDHFIRAANTAYWLRALGLDARVLDVDVSKPGIDFPSRPVAVARVDAPLTEVSAGDVAANIASLTLIDLRASAAYRDGHVEGATWSIRPLLPTLDVTADSDVVLMADDKALADLAAIDLREAGVAKIRYLAGGPEDWRGAGLTISATPNVPSDRERIDFLFFVFDRHLGNKASSEAYLAWELGLIEQLKDWERALYTL